MHEAERLAVEAGELVRVIERRQDVAQDRQRHALGKAAARAEALDDVIKRAPFEVLHGDEVAAVRFVDVVGLHDIRVIEARRHARLLEEHGEELFVFDQIGAQLLERDQLGEAGRPLGRRHIYDSHSAASHLADEAVAPDDIAERVINVGHEHPLLLVRSAPQ